MTDRDDDETISDGIPQHIEPEEATGWPALAREEGPSPQGKRRTLDLYRTANFFNSCG